MNKRNDYGYISHPQKGPIYSYLKEQTLWNRAKFYVIGVVVVSTLLIMAILAHAEPVCPPWVIVAQRELGRGEIDSDNYGPDVKKYLQGKEGLSWCAGFVSYCLQKSGYEGKYILRARDYLKVGKLGKEPEPGDLIVFWRINPKATTGHVGIVESVTQNTITTIEGNIGEFPSKVKRIVYLKNNIKKLLGFVRLSMGDAL